MKHERFIQLPVLGILLIASCLGYYRPAQSMDLTIVPVTFDDWPELCRYGKLREYKELLERYPQLIRERVEDASPLQRATMGFLEGCHTNSELIRFLLEKGGEKRFSSGRTFENELMYHCLGCVAGRYPNEAERLLKVLDAYRTSKVAKKSILLSLFRNKTI